MKSTPTEIRIRVDLSPNLTVGRFSSCQHRVSSVCPELLPIEPARLGKIALLIYVIKILKNLRAVDILAMICLFRSAFRRPEARKVLAHVVAEPYAAVCLAIHA